MSQATTIDNTIGLDAASTKELWARFRELEGVIGRLAGAGDILWVMVGDGDRSVPATALEWFACRMEEHIAAAEEASAACRAAIAPVIEAYPAPALQPDAAIALP